MNFQVLPPEINSLLMFSGAGSAPMLAAAAAWDGLASELGSAASSFGSVTSVLAAQSWRGPASTAMLAAASPYAGWLNVAATQAQRAASQAKAVVGVFESAQAATVHPLVVAANRDEFVQLVQSNFLGQNAPAIAAAEAQYEEMWAADVAAMTGYHGGASAAAAQLSSWQGALPALPGMSQVASAVAGSPVGAAAAAVSMEASTVPGLPALNTGLGNIGSWNLGGGNIGNTNLGSGNVGNTNLGSGNIGSANLGSGNIGNTNLGSGNQGSNNFGLGNIGNTNLGSGNVGSNNFGLGQRVH